MRKPLLTEPVNDNKTMRENVGLPGSMDRVFYDHRGKPCDKWHHYLEVYERYLRRFTAVPSGRDFCPKYRLLEIGVQRGGSLEIWREFLGPSAVIRGLDIDPACQAHQNLEKGLFVYIGSQNDPDLLRSIVSEMGGIDVVVDDGGHYNSDQIVTFETLYPLLNDGGVYICEDTHTSYWPEYGGSPSGQGSFIEYAKCLVDQLHGWHTDAVKDETFASRTRSVLFYDSMVVIERQDREMPSRSVVGGQ